MITAFKGRKKRALDPLKGRLGRTCEASGNAIRGPARPVEVDKAPLAEPSTTSTPPRPGAGYPDLSQEQQGKEDHHNPDPELNVLRGRGFDHLDARHDAKEGRDQEREHQPRLVLPPRVSHHRCVDEHREHGREDHNRRRIVDEQEERRADQGEPVPGEPRDGHGQ